MIDGSFGANPWKFNRSAHATSFSKAHKNILVGEK
jgi:hypothetical protein